MVWEEYDGCIRWLVSLDFSTLIFVFILSMALLFRIVNGIGILDFCLCIVNGIVILDVCFDVVNAILILDLCLHIVNGCRILHFCFHIGNYPANLHASIVISCTSPSIMLLSYNVCISTSWGIPWLYSWGPHEWTHNAWYCYDYRGFISQVYISHMDCGLNY